MSKVYTEQELEKYNVYMHKFMNFNEPKDKLNFTLAGVMSPAFAERLPLPFGTQLRFKDHDPRNEYVLDYSLVIKVDDTLKFKIKYHAFMHNDWRGEDSCWEMRCTTPLFSTRVKVKNVKAVEAELENWNTRIAAWLASRRLEIALAWKSNSPVSVLPYDLLPLLF